MLKNPVVKFIGMFLLGGVVTVAAQWLAAVLKGTAFEVNWIYILGMGLFIAILDLLIPAEKRKENREKLMKRFKR